VATIYLWRSPSVRRGLTDGGLALGFGTGDGGPATADAATIGPSPTPSDAGPAPDGALVMPIRHPRDAGVPVSGRGRLVVSAPDAPWTHVLLDGKEIGQTPIPAPGVEVPAGKHKLTVRCEPEVCAPEGKERSADVVVPADGTVGKEFRWEK
jgi:hypothetical protein